MPGLPEGLITWYSVKLDPGIIVDCFFRKWIFPGVFFAAGAWGKSVKIISNSGNSLYLPKRPKPKTFGIALAQVAIS